MAAKCARLKKASVAKSQTGKKQRRQGRTQHSTLLPAQVRANKKARRRKLQRIYEQRRREKAKKALAFANLTQPFASLKTATLGQDCQTLAMPRPHPPPQARCRLTFKQPAAMFEVPPKHKEIQTEPRALAEKATQTDHLHPFSYEAHLDLTHKNFALNREAQTLRQELRSCQTMLRAATWQLQVQSLTSSGT